MPPSPAMNGSTTVCAKPVATAASKALRPRASTAAPTSAARGCGATTMPRMFLFVFISLHVLRRGRVAGWRKIDSSSRLPPIHLFQFVIPVVYHAGMELRDLKYLIEVAAAGHIGRAAERLGITQPALTKCVSRLERELN